MEAFEAHKGLCVNSPILEANSRYLNPAILELTKIDPCQQFFLRSQDRFHMLDLEIIDLLSLVFFQRTDFRISASNSSHPFSARPFLSKIDPQKQVCLRAQGQFPNQDLQIIELLTP